MPITVFSATDCIRCQIVKNYLAEKNIPFEEHDIKSETGNDAFKAFYREHRAEVRRDEGGIFFPIVVDGMHVVQDAGVALAWFICGNRLDGIVTPNNLGHGWIGGLNIAACDKETASFFLEVLRFLKAGGLATSLAANGKNAFLLESILAEKLADKLEFVLTGSGKNSPELAASLAAVKKYAGNVEKSFTLDIYGPEGVITPAEVAETAKLMAEFTGDNRLPLRIACSSPDQSVNLLPYRTESRRWQVLTTLA